ncbi:MAG TPA: hypothetical protein VNK43_08475 [Gemmatimonadales bacterium]|nr:hypothetical protein [Gemmatimonadales bacterium]
MQRFFIIALGFLLAVAGVRRLVAQQQAQPRPVAAALASEFRLQGAQVSTPEGGRVTVAFTDPSFAALSPAERTERARAMAAWVWRRYAREAGARTVQVIHSMRDAPGAAGGQKTAAFEFSGSSLER